MPFALSLSPSLSLSFFSLFLAHFLIVLALWEGVGVTLGNQGAALPVLSRFWQEAIHSCVQGFLVKASGRQ